MKKVGVGVIGCGNICPAYLGNISKQFASILDLKACADLDLERARKRAAEFNAAKACTVEELLADRDIEVVLNLTTFPAHYQVSMSVLNARKHLFTEKSLAQTREQGREIVDTAKKNGLLVAGASDTFLSAGPQAALRAIDAGEIGQPSFATVFIGLAGRSEHYLNVFGGPVFDMLPYYLHVILAALGPATRVASSAQTPVAEYPYPPQHPKAGEKWKVTRPTTVSGVMDFAGGCVCSVTASVDTCAYFPRMEIYGPKATLVYGDVNGYRGNAVLRFKDGSTRELPLEGGFRDDGRALGVAEMALALRTGRQPRAGGDLMYHALDLMHALHESSKEGRHLDLHSTFARPAPFDYAAFIDECKKT